MSQLGAVFSYSIPLAHTYTHTHTHTHTVIFSLFRIHTFSTPNVRWCNMTSNPTRYRCGHPCTHAWPGKKNALLICVPHVFVNSQCNHIVVAFAGTLSPHQSLEVTGHAFLLLASSLRLWESLHARGISKTLQ